MHIDMRRRRRCRWPLHERTSERMYMYKTRRISTTKSRPFLKRQQYSVPANPRRRPLPPQHPSMPARVSRVSAALDSRDLPDLPTNASTHQPINASTHQPINPSTRDAPTCRPRLVGRVPCDPRHSSTARHLNISTAQATLPPSIKLETAKGRLKSTFNNRMIPSWAISTVGSRRRRMSIGTLSVPRTAIFLHGHVKRGMMMLSSV